MEYIRITGFDQLKVLNDRLTALEIEHYSLTAERELFAGQPESEETAAALVGLDGQIAALDLAHGDVAAMLRRKIVEIAATESESSTGDSE